MFVKKWRRYMKKQYMVKLQKKNSTGSFVTTQVSADSSSEARQVALKNKPDYKVVSVTEKK